MSESWPIMKTQCPSCPFREGSCMESIRDDVMERVATASQRCHHPRFKGKKETHLCRGARDFQLQMLHATGFLEAATDAAWTKKCEEMGIQQDRNKMYAKK